MCAPGILNGAVPSHGQANNNSLCYSKWRKHREMFGCWLAERCTVYPLSTPPLGGLRPCFQMLGFTRAACYVCSVCAHILVANWLLAVVAQLAASYATYLVALV